MHIKGKPFKPEHGENLGYLPEERGLYKKESVLDVMVYFGRLKGFSRQAAKDWSMTYLDRMALADKAKIRLDKLSSGEQQKIQLGVTVMNSPELLILDEPTKGFDPVNRRLLMEIIEEQKKSGATVLMVTHQMEEVERLCDRVIFLKNGQSEAYGTVEEVQNLYGGQTIRMTCSGTVPPSQNYVISRQQPNHVELAINEGADQGAILQELLAGGLQVREFTTGKLSLDEVFIRIYGEQDNAETAAVA
ncbi:daunorubicin/doxorubicin resistance ATP-binding protein DrrA [mine drainage metagenome]|uniref:Daunorubicin/doxorubicin resistance ATP-binding protein DrrA n=1 Tax=mine drainage metagenome TaxID=410659 RepID=A0A1J5QGR6_9ZZZZ